MFLLILLLQLCEIYLYYDLIFVSITKWLSKDIIPDIITCCLDRRAKSYKDYVVREIYRIGWCYWFASLPVCHIDLLAMIIFLSLTWVGSEFIFVAYYTWFSNFINTESRDKIAECSLQYHLLHLSPKTDFLEVPWLILVLVFKITK